MMVRLYYDLDPYFYLSFNFIYRAVSVVDGYNLPLRITPGGGCHLADCPVDLGPNCKSSALQT